MALFQRLYHFLSKPAVDPANEALYRAAITQARHPEFYRDFGVSDTLDGRFDMLLLHVVLLMRRMAGRPEKRQALFDLMFTDMDRSLREMGVGDMSIGKKIRPMISAFYGRAQAYEKALQENDGILMATLNRNLYGGRLLADDILQGMASYVRLAVAGLDAQSLDDIAAGRVVFPLPQL